MAEKDNNGEKEIIKRLLIATLILLVVAVMLLTLKVVLELTNVEDTIQSMMNNKSAEEIIMERAEGGAKNYMEAAEKESQMIEDAMQQLMLNQTSNENRTVYE